MHPSQGMRSTQMPLNYPYSANSVNISPQYSYVSSPITNLRSLHLSPSMSPTSLSNMQQVQQTTAQMGTNSPSLTQAFVSARGVPNTATKSDLVALFEPFGPLTHISLSGSQALIGTTQEAVNTMMCYFVNSPPRIHNKFLTLHLVKQAPPQSSFSVPNSPGSFRRGLSPQLSPQQYTKTLSQNQQSFAPMSLPFPSIPSPSSMQTSNMPTVNMPLSALNSNMVSAQPFTPVTSYMPMNMNMNMNMYDPNMNLNSVQFSPQITANTLGNTNNMMNAQAMNNNSASTYYSGGFAYPTTSVILVSNLPTTSSTFNDTNNENSNDNHENRDEKLSSTAEHVSCIFTCDELFTLFGIYGDVLRVKILFHHPSSALIQLASPLHAEMCCQHLNHIVLYGRQITVTPSKYSEVEVPKSEAENMGRDRTPLTKEYLRSPAHRFRNIKNNNTNTYLRNLHPLSTVLHVSSIAASVSEQDLRYMFSVEIDPEEVSIQFIDHSQNTPPLSSYYDSTDYNSSSKQSQTPGRKTRSFSVSSDTHPDIEATSIPSPAHSSSSQSDSPTSTSSSLSQPPQSPRSTTSVSGTSVVPQKQAFIRLPTLQSAVLAIIHNHNKLVDGRYMRVSFARKEPTINPNPDRTRRASLPGNSYNISQSQTQQKSSKSTTPSWASSPNRSSSGSSSVNSSPAWSNRPLNASRETNAGTTPTSSRLRPFLKADPFDSFDTKIRQHQLEQAIHKDSMDGENIKQDFEKSTNINDSHLDSPKQQESQSKSISGVNQSTLPLDDANSNKDREIIDPKPHKLPELIGKNISTNKVVSAETKSPDLVSS